MSPGTAILATIFLSLAWGILVGLCCVAWFLYRVDDGAKTTTTLTSTAAVGLPVMIAGALICSWVFYGVIRDNPERQDKPSDRQDRQISRPLDRDVDPLHTEQGRDVPRALEAKREPEIRWRAA